MSAWVASNPVVGAGQACRPRHLAASRPAVAGSMAPIARPIQARRVALKSSEAPSVPIEKSGPSMKPLKDIQEIMDILPHRCVARVGH